MQSQINRKGEKPPCTGIIVHIMSLNSLHSFWQAWVNPEGKGGQNELHYPSAILQIDTVILVLKKRKQVQRN